MSNICENVLKIQGSYTAILRFDERFRNGKEKLDKNYSLNNLYPAPPLSMNDACEWCYEHWGVKGDFPMESFAHEYHQKR